ncbi:hypothetical protein GAMM_10097 [Gammaproteobacteria bacterium]
MLEKKQTCRLLKFRYQSLFGSKAPIDDMVDEQHKASDNLELGTK